MRKLGLHISFILFMGLLLSLPCFGEAVIPKPTNEFFVNDFAGVLDKSDEQYIQLAAVQLQEATTAQVVVVTIRSLQGEPLENYAYQLFKQWGIGTAEQNNGVLILVAVDDRKSRIEVGYGLEGALPDGKTGRIQDEYMIPYFKENDYGSGIRNGFLAIAQEVYEEYGMEPGNLDMPYRGESSETNGDDIGQGILFIIIIVVLLIDWIFLRGRITRFFLIASMYNKRGGGFHGGRGSGRGGGGFSGGGGRSGGGGSSRGW
jgi:uncharacterized protein